MSNKEIEGLLKNRKERKKLKEICKSLLETERKIRELLDRLKK